VVENILKILFRRVFACAILLGLLYCAGIILFGQLLSYCEGWCLEKMISPFFPKQHSHPWAEQILIQDESVKNVN